MSEGVLSKSGIIYGRCQDCNHTVDVGMILGRELKLYIGVTNFWEGNRMFFRFAEVTA